MKRLLLAASVLTLGVGTAYAADLQKPVYKAAPSPAAAPVPVYNWTGFYIGAHVGGDWFHKDWFVPDTPTNSGCSSIGCPASAGSHKANSWLAGGQVGFNYQVAWWVWGVEAQASWTNLEASNPNALLPITTDHSKTKSLGTIAARVGGAWDRTLFYVKGGGAWAQDTFSNSSPECDTVTCQTLDDWRWGWMVGVGLEYAFWDNWSAKIEYDHLDFGRRRETLAPVCTGCSAFEYDVKQTLNLVKVGLNYRFNFGKGKAPVVARY